MMVVWYHDGDLLIGLKKSSVKMRILTAKFYLAKR